MCSLRRSYTFDEAGGDFLGDVSGQGKDIDLTAELSWGDAGEVEWITPGVCGAALE